MMSIFEKELNELVLSDEFSGNILIGDQNEILLEKAFGDACKSFNIKNEIDTKHNIASIGKTFTGVAVAQLAENRKLSFDDSLSKYISSSMLDTSISKKVELRHLLTHTSGFGDYFSFAYSHSYQTQYRELEDFIPIIQESTLSFEPGTKWSYSNLGFLLLGFVIEKVSDMSFYDYVHTNIFNRAGMINSSYSCSDEPESNRAIGYYKAQDKTGKEIFRDNCVKPVLKGSPSGGCYSTTKDLYNFCISLANNRLISENYKLEVLSPKPDICSTNYGYGFFINGNIISHSGDGTGINAKLEYDLQTGRIIVILSNYSSPSAQKVFSICKDHFI